MSHREMENANEINHLRAQKKANEINHLRDGWVSARKKTAEAASFTLELLTQSIMGFATI